MPLAPQFHLTESERERESPKESGMRKKDTDRPIYSAREAR